MRLYRERKLGIAMYTTYHRGLTDSLTLLKAWDIFQTSMAHIQLTTVVEATLSFSEFKAIAEAPTSLSILGWNGDQVLQSIIVLDSDIKSNPWINADFVKQRYPDAFAKGKVLYVWMAAAAEGAPASAITRVLKAGFELCAQANEVVIFEICERTMHFHMPITAQTFQRVAQSVVNAPMEVLSVLTFFGMELSPKPAADRVFDLTALERELEADRLSASVVEDLAALDAP